MDESLVRAEGIFKRCSTCFNNLIQSICEFTCGKNTSAYIEITDPQQVPGNLKNGPETQLRFNQNIFLGSTEIYANEITINISEEYMKSAYKSCKDVSVPQTGQLAMDLACGMPSEFCDPFK